MRTENIEYLIPTWAIPALEYGDLSGLSEEDIERLEAFEHKVGERMDSMGASHYHWDVSGDESGFYRSNDVSPLGCHCIEARAVFFFDK